MDLEAPAPVIRLTEFRDAHEAKRLAKIATARSKVITAREAYHQALAQLRQALGGDARHD